MRDLNALARSIKEAQASSAMSEFDFPSRVPILGPFIRSVRKLWNNIAARWYVRHYVQQQMAFNTAVLDALQAIRYWGISVNQTPSFAELAVEDELSALIAFSRQQQQAVYLGNQTLLCRTLGKYMMYVEAEDVGITPHLCLSGIWEPWITLVMQRTLKPGWHCLDVGANHGYYTLVMADAVGYRGRVLAIEPTPRLAQLLEFTLMVNGFERWATILQKAVSDMAAQNVKLMIPKNLGMNATLCGDIDVSDCDTIEVETVTLDELTKDWPAVDMVKIDTEGAEEAVWRGMQGMLRNNPDVIVILEVNCARYAEPMAFLQEIQKAEFVLRYIDFDATIKEISADRIVNERVGQDWMLFLKR